MNDTEWNTVRPTTVIVIHGLQFDKHLNLSDICKAGDVKIGIKLGNCRYLLKILRRVNAGRI